MLWTRTNDVTTTSSRKGFMRRHFYFENSITRSALPLATGFVNAYVHARMAKLISRAGLAKTDKVARLFAEMIERIAITFPSLQPSLSPAMPLMMAFHLIRSRAISASRLVLML